MNEASLKRTIMRRVYYACGIKIATHPLVTHGILIAAATFALTYFVSFPDVVANLMQVKVGEVGQYFIGSLLHTELWTVVLLALTAGALVSLVRRLRRFESATMAYVR